MPSSRSPSQNKKYRILVVDDEPDVAQSVRSILEKMYDVDILAHPVKALDYFRAHRYDLVLLDTKCRK